MNARQFELIKQERIKLQAALANAGSGHRVRCITAVARSILLEGEYHYNGRWCEPKAKSVGAGVYEVWLKETKGPHER